MAANFFPRSLLAMVFGMGLGFLGAEHFYNPLQADLKEDQDKARLQLKNLDLTPFKAITLVAKVVRPSVVSVRGQKNKTREILEGQGSGLILDDKGHILTNHHVVNGMTDLQVRLSDKRELKAKLIGVDVKTDLAVIQIEADNLMPARLGDSESLEIGEKVVAIGSPFDLEQTVTEGIVSAKGRELHIRRDAYEDFIQTDAAINPGNSGGPLVNLRGEVIGINTAIISDNRGNNIGIGFAVPIRMAQMVAQALITTGKVERGYLGVQIGDLAPEMAAKANYTGLEGVLVVAVTKDSPAEKGGLKEGDILFSLDHKPISGANDLRNRIALVRSGESVTLEVWREGKMVSLTVQIEAQPSTESKTSAKSR